MSKDILVVDTPDQGLHDLVHALGESGYVPTTLLADDDPALQFADHEYELVIVNLQAGDARALCEGIRSNPEGAITPILFIGTGNEGIRSPADALSIGGDYYFGQPLDMGRVLTKVQTYLGPGTSGLPRPPSFAQAPRGSASSSPLAGASDRVLAQIAHDEAEQKLRRDDAAVQARQADEQQRKQQAEATAAAQRRAQDAEAQRLAEQQRLTQANEERRRLAENHEAELRRQAEAAAAVAAARARAAAEAEAKLQRQAEEAVAEQAARQKAQQQSDQQTQEARQRLAERQARDHEALAQLQRDEAALEEASLTPTIENHAVVPVPGSKPLRPDAGVLSVQTDVAVVLIQAFRQAVSGRLDFTAGQRQKALFLENGGVVDATSTQPFDRIEEYLLREGKITRPQYQATRLKQLRTARQVGAYLVSEGLLKPQELFAAVRGHLEEQVFSLFEWEEGTFRYQPVLANEADRVGLDIDPRALVMEGIRRKYLLPRLVGKVGSPSSLVGLTGQAGGELGPLRLTGAEVGVARLLDGQRSLDDVVFSSGMEALRIYQVVWGLMILGGAQVMVRGIEGLTDGSTSNDAIDRGRIADKLEQVRQLDYFQILGLQQTATPYEVERACQHLLQEFDRGRFSPALLADLGGQLDEIAEVLDEARDVLMDTARRDAYARHTQGV